MALILNIETSTKNCSVSLARNGELISSKELNEGSYSHAEKLHLFITEVIEEAQLKLSDITAVAVSKGPGSFTGLRIGVSAAKGICFSLDIPMISVDTLLVLAKTVRIDKGLIVPLLDARRMEVYSAVYDHTYKQIRQIEAEIISEQSFDDYLEQGTIVFTGDGAEKCKEIIQHKNATFLSDKFPSAKNMAALSYEKYQKNDTENVAYFEPFYLKDFVAASPKKKA